MGVLSTTFSTLAASATGFGVGMAYFMREAFTLNSQGMLTLTFDAVQTAKVHSFGIQALGPTAFVAIAHHVSAYVVDNYLEIQEGPKQALVIMSMTGLTATVSALAFAYFSAISLPELVVINGTAIASYCIFQLIVSALPNRNADPTLWTRIYPN